MAYVSPSYGWDRLQSEASILFSPFWSILQLATEQSTERGRVFAAPTNHHSSHLGMALASMLSAHLLKASFAESQLFRIFHPTASLSQVNAITCWADIGNLLAEANITFYLSPLLCSKLTWRQGLPSTFCTTGFSLAPSIPTGQGLPTKSGSLLATPGRENSKEETRKKEKKDHGKVKHVRHCTVVKGWNGHQSETTTDYDRVLWR